MSLRDCSILNGETSMKFLRLPSFLLVAGLISLPPSQLDAQACFPEWFCAVNLQLGDNLGYGPAPSGVYAEPTFWHSDCLVCVGDESPWGLCHFPCGDMVMGTEYEELLEAVLEGDIKTAFAHLLQAKPHVGWNPARHAIQLLSMCDEPGDPTVVASIELGRSAAALFLDGTVPKIGDRGLNRR